MNINLESKTFTFHIHLPEGIEKIGQPIILGNVEELGFWDTPIIKLLHPFPKNPTHWQSEPITISVSNTEKNRIQYRFAIHVQSPALYGNEEKNIFEGDGDKDNRILDTERENQYAIWKNNSNLSQRLNLAQVKDCAFVDYIFNSIRAYNLKDMIMEYRHLLNLYDDVTIRASNLEYIINNTDNKLKEKRIFLCLLLGYYILRRNLNYELPTSFSSELLLDALDNYDLETFPSDIKVPIHTAITTLIQHNASRYYFHWVKIFTIATKVDPKYNFIYHLNTLKYPSDDLLEKFIKEVEIIGPYIKDVEFEIYINIAKWLIQLCHNNDSLLKLWNDILLHNDEIDKNIVKFFINQFQKNISKDDVVALETHFKKIKIPKNYQDNVAEIFRNHILFLLEDPIRKWEDQDIFAIRNILQDDSLNWSSDDAILSLEFISRSCNLKLLDIFPELLDNFFRNNFSDTKKKRLPSICTNWFTLLLLILNVSNECNFIFLIFYQLERMHPLLSHRKNIWQNFTTIAIENLKACPESQIINAIKLVDQIKEKEIKELFSDIIKEMIFKTIQQIDDRLIDKIFMICGCESNKLLEVPNTMIEDTLCYILDGLQRKSNLSDTSEQYLNIIKFGKFWILILNATGSVEKLNGNSYFKHIQISTVKINRLLIEKSINIQLLQQILKYSDEQLFQYLNEAIGKKKSLDEVIVTQGEIANLRKLCHNYELKLNQLFKFYNELCSAFKITDVNDFTQDLKKRMHNLDNVILNQTMLSDHWLFHEKVLNSAILYYKFNQSQIFRNIIEVYFKEDDDATNVEYIAQKLMPSVFEKYDSICKQFKEWEKLKRSDVSLLLRNITNVNVELDFMEGYISSKNRFIQALDNISKIPQWIERFENLKNVAKIFKVPINEDGWLSKSIRILKNDSRILRVLNDFFDYFGKNHSINQDCWDLIKALSVAEDLIIILQIIDRFGIKYLINYTDLSEKLIQEDQEDTISSLIQVKHFLFPLMNKDKIENVDELLKGLWLVIEKDSTIVKKITLCNNIRVMYDDTLNRDEVTKERIKNIVLNGTYVFACDEKKDKCLVSLRCFSNNLVYNLNEILDLCERAFLMEKSKKTVDKSIDDILNDYDTVMDEFILQVDVVQKIINIASMLMELGHFGYRKFEKKIQKTSDMEDYLIFLNNELEKWKDIIDRAREKCYYLTFFSIHRILAFYDYFTSKILDKKNEEECNTLIKFVNGKARLSSHKDVQDLLCGPKDNYEILCVIGDELKRIFESIPRQPRKINAVGQRVMSDIVTKGKLFVAACTDDTRTPNVIMSLYANHGYYPEPWQLLICTTSTTMEELIIFIKRSFLASNNGYENHLFCIANLELLDFELQYNLANQIRLLRDQKNDFLLAIICCRESGMHHYILGQFSSDVHATNGLNIEAMRGIYKELHQNIIRVSSDLSGQGKTEWIKENSFSKGKFTCSFLINDGMDFGMLVRQFKECKLRFVESLHINIISTDYPKDVNMFLFELLTLGIVSTNVDIVRLPTSTYIYIEVASTTEQYLLNSLPMAGYLLFNHLSWNIKNLRVSQEIHSPIQVACNYLNLLDSNEIDTKEILFKTDKAIKEPLPAERCQNLIKKYFFNKNAEDISSFRFVEIFVNVLADQLVRLSSSQLLSVDNLKLVVKENNIRNLIVRAFIDVSKDFATRSIKTKEAQLEAITAYDYDDKNARLGTIVQWDDSNHHIIFFNSQIPDKISCLYRDRTKVHDNVKIFLKSQVTGDLTKWELNDYNSMSVDTLFLKLEYLARKTTQKLDLPEYALSVENLIKMALILLRARANIPVIVCGEAGCGKTSLIVYLALMVEVQFQALNLHAGIDEETIMMFMNDALEKAERGEIWLLFDEINTSNYIGLLADLISHRMLNGMPIHPNIRLFAACNPYRLRTKAQSQAGLTNRVKKFEEQSKLVYQVKPLPDQILDYVWDYGILKPKDEYRYIQIMVEKELKTSHPVFAELLFASQNFIRKVEEPYSVSLRDVKRAIKLVIFFHKSIQNRPANRFGHVYPPPGNPTIWTRSYVLALSLCYHFRLYEQDLRRQYRCEMGQILHNNHDAFVGENMFAKIIREEQEDYIRRMRCPPNTAYSEALLENVLVMIVCILTKIPLFLIGAPGSSKSLAIRLISLNLRGTDSYDKYFRNLPQIYLIPHQGTSSSTSDGIIKVFDKANRFQETTSTQFPVISVVLLDKVDLAETSLYNPLKVLHSLLEPSYPATGPTVSVIGISNCRLDNSKSSRALLVQRPQFDLDDLVDTAERLLNKRVVRSHRGVLRPLAKAYLNYEKHGQSLPNFHGLRDYYALIKRLSLCEMTPENIQMALARNFGGTENHVKLCELYFGYVLKMFNNHKPWLYTQIPIEQLITSNLDDSDARHLMVVGKSESIVNLLTYQLRKRDLDPVVILGSQFPDDQEDYYYSVLKRIMMCVEIGRPLILTDLEIIYGSLYDLWDQNYIVESKDKKNNDKYFTRVTFGAYVNPMLYVSPNFKCILVMDENKLTLADPPLLNRFEKQKMSINDTLNNKQKLFVENLGDWARKMSTLIGVNPITLRNKFTQKNLFIGFDKDETLQSLIIDITKNNPEADDDEILEKCKECLIATASSDGVVRAEKSALERDEVDRWKQVYFRKQHHNSLYDYFANQEDALSDPNGHLVIINTFSNINTDGKSCLQELVSCQVDKLSIFKTEVQLSNRLKHFWSESTDQMLILQCDLTNVNTGCIKLAKFIIEQFRNEYITKRDQVERKMPTKHACIILHIHRDQESTFTSFNFMCGWKQMTIETLSGSDVPTSGLPSGV